MKALITLATGSHEEFLEIALPSFKAFADRHEYEIIQPDMRCSRPASWWKIPALMACLSEGFSEALWVDADVVIVDPSDDLPVPANAWQALVEHHTADGDVPNCGVWLVREPMVPWLDKLWGMTQYLHHGWWEQAALLDLLGYSPKRPTFHAKRTPLYDRTHWLDNGFNVHMWDTPTPARPRFMHASMHDDRAEVMREWAATASC